VREGGRDEEGEDEGRERPEGPVEVGRGREVEGGVCWGEGIEGVDAAEEDSFCIDIEMVLVVVYIPEGRFAGIRDVAYKGV